MKGEIYTVAFMPSSGRRIRTFSLSTFKLGLISTLFVAFLVLLFAFGSLATWRSYREHEKSATEAVKNYEALNRELQAVRKSYTGDTTI